MGGPGRHGRPPGPRDLRRDLALSLQKYDEKANSEHESTDFAASRRLQASFIGYDHRPFWDRFAPVSRRARVRGVAAL
jgi:hypothetical protein